MRPLLFLLLMLIPCPAAERVIHVFVALADNASQGIQRVPPKIGNGDDPENNLYWGCDDGMKTVFSRSKVWKRISSAQAVEPRGCMAVLLLSLSIADFGSLRRLYMTGHRH